MKTIIFSAIVALLLAASASAETIIKYGVALPKNPEEGFSDVKAMFISKQGQVTGPLVYQLEGGGWTDSIKHTGRKSSLMASPSLGINVNAGYVFTQALLGPAVISSPDSILGGMGQFNNDFAIGLKDKDASIAFAYKHLSSAGIFQPNAGRDFIMLRVGVNF